ncbi:MAG: M48 family metalloprotease, partial [Alphaproteobacteria bacterium]
MIKKILLFLFLIIPVFANAGGVVRDVETEQAFKMFNSEIEKEMNKSRDKITYRLILDDTFNAMVMGGKNIYYNSGLILDIKTLDEFVAVSAHEMAHIKNGDLDKVANAYEKSKKLGAYGMAAAVLGGLAASSGDAVIGGV